MNTNSAVTVMHQFLDRSPRTAVEVQLELNDEQWLWRFGKAAENESAVFEIGSVGKTFTTTLLALLIQRQQVSLSDTVTQFYPALPWAKHTTLQQLASHTSGLPANPFSQWQLIRRGRQLAETFQEEDLMVFLRGLPSTLKNAEEKPSIMGSRAFPEMRYMLNILRGCCFAIREISISFIHFFRAVTVTLLSRKNDFAHRS